MFWIILGLTIRKILKRFFPQLYLKLLRTGIVMHLKKMSLRYINILPEKYATKLAIEINSEES
jgi:hypothetical protein